jgi:hypothetical protein
MAETDVQIAKNKRFATKANFKPPWKKMSRGWVKVYTLTSIEVGIRFRSFSHFKYRGEYKVLIS